MAMTTATAAIAVEATEPTAATHAVPSPSTITISTSGVQVATPEIRWHCGPTGLNEAVLSLDFLHRHRSPCSDATATTTPTPAPAPTVLATGGADKEIKLWRVLPELKENDGLEFIFSLTGHDRSVNCVRFSPNGQYLASASDDSSIIVWTRPKTASDDWSWDTITSFSDISRTLLACGHKGDITDLCWSPDSLHLCSGSVDNCSVVWNVEKGEVVERRKDHTQYVQGVAWDPLGEFLVTEGNDRTCRVYSLTGFDAVSRQAHSNAKKHVRKCTNLFTLKSREFPQSVKDKTEGEDMPASTDVTSTATATDAAVDGGDATASSKGGPPKHRLFLDDTCPVFARRLTWTPCGSYLLAPTGVFRATETATAVNTVYAFARGNMSKPALHLPGHEKASLGVRCNPLVYELRKAATNNVSANFFQTPQRSVFAVITLNAVIVYDSQQRHPLCTIKNLHYADLTDATWSADGQILSISSMDGYISFIRFGEGFFGASIPHDELTKTNEEKTRWMFTTVTKTNTKKKAKPQQQTAGAPDAVPAATTTTSEDQVSANGSTATAAAIKSPAVKKKVAAVASSPLLQAFQKRDASQLGGDAAKPIDVSGSESSSGVVNTLQVRKKRKIAPTLVTLASSSVESSTSQDATAIDLTADPTAQQTPSEPVPVEATSAGTSTTSEAQDVVVVVDDE